MYIKAFWKKIQILFPHQLFLRFQTQNIIQRKNIFSKCCYGSSFIVFFTNVAQDVNYNFSQTKQKNYFEILLTSNSKSTSQ